MEEENITQNNETDILLTTSEVKKTLRTSITNLYVLIRSGKLKAINIGGGSVRKNWRIRKSELDRFLSEV